MSTEAEEVKIGGIAFYLSFFSFAILDAFNLINLVKLNAGGINWQRWIAFFISVALGVVVASIFIKGKFSILLHELRHALVSNLVGNKWKALVVNNKSGHFEYAYSKKTARFNAFVSLAPYIFPMFLIVGGGISILLFHRSEGLLVVVFVSFFYGIDASLNIRDISPHQSDLTDITGGFFVALAYVVLINIFIFTVLAGWVSADLEGPKYMAKEFWYYVMSLYY